MFKKKGLAFLSSFLSAGVPACLKFSQKSLGEGKQGGHQYECVQGIPR